MQRNQDGFTLVEITVVLVLMAIAYVDLAFAFYTFVSATALLEYFRRRHLGWAMYALRPL